MGNFFSNLQERVNQSNSLLCVGLDPHPEDLNTVDRAGVLSFCKRIITSTSQYAAAFKPNAAFFEAHGEEGWRTLKEVIELIRGESDRLGVIIPIILDAKRGDIASSAEGYAKSAFELLGVDSITLNPYLGRDSIEPFLNFPEKGVFLLCKTSNQGAADLQDLRIEGPDKSEEGKGMQLYEYIARLAQTWNTSDNIGLVVGATQPEALRKVRKEAPDLWFLSPGVGIQGGDLETAMQNGLRKDGRGMLINLSRNLSRSKNPEIAAAKFCEQVTVIRQMK